MTLAWFDCSIVALYCIVGLAVGLTLTKRASKSTGNDSRADRAVPSWLADISVVATRFASDTPLLVNADGHSRTVGASGP